MMLGATSNEGSSAASIPGQNMIAARIMGVGLYDRVNGMTDSILKMPLAELS